MIRRVASVLLAVPVLLLLGCSGTNSSPETQDSSPAPTAPSQTACEVFGEEHPRLNDALDGKLGDAAKTDALLQLSEALSTSSDEASAIPGAVDALSGDTATETIEALTSYCDAIADGVGADYSELVGVQAHDANCTVLGDRAMEYLNGFPTELESAEAVMTASSGARALADSMDALFPSELATLSAEIRIFADQADAEGLMIAVMDSYSAIDWSAAGEVCPAIGF